MCKFLNAVILCGGLLVTTGCGGGPLVGSIENIFVISDIDSLLEAIEEATSNEPSATPVPTPTHTPYGGSGGGYYGAQAPLVFGCSDAVTAISLARIASGYDGMAPEMPVAVTLRQYRIAQQFLLGAHEYPGLKDDLREAMEAVAEVISRSSALDTEEALNAYLGRYVSAQFRPVTVADMGTLGRLTARIIQSLHVVCEKPGKKTNGAMGEGTRVTSR